MCVRSKSEEENREFQAQLMNSSHVGMDLKSKTKAIQHQLRKQKRQAMDRHSATATATVQQEHEFEPIPEPTPGTFDSQICLQKVQVEPDVIAVVTARYRHLIIAVADLFDTFQQTKLYKVIFHTTQPAHLVTLVAVITVAALVFPRQESNLVQEDTVSHSPLMNFIYLASFMAHFGAQIWMTFVSGLTLYFALPRHTFGGVQIVLFPKYFSINSFLSLVTLIVFVKLHPATTWDYIMIVQVCAMVVCFLTELIIRLYLAPPMLKLIAAKNAIELAAGVGLEVGEHSVGPLALCPHYLGLHRAFRSVHMSVAAGNMMAMACTTLHLWYLANKIC